MRRQEANRVLPRRGIASSVDRGRGREVQEGGGVRDIASGSVVQHTAAEGALGCDMLNQRGTGAQADRGYSARGIGIGREPMQCCVRLFDGKRSLGCAGDETRHREGVG